MIALKNILVPVDFSEHSAKAVRYGVELAASFGATVHLLHAVEATPMLYGEAAAFLPTEVTAEIERSAAKQLDELHVEAPDNVPLKRTVAEGHAFVEIVRYGKVHEIDLIILGTHGRGAIAHMLLGSVAEKVVRKAPCPVLVVRDKEHDFVMP